MILIADVRQLSDRVLYEKAYQLLPDERKQKAERMKSEADRQRTLAAGLLLNRAVAMYNSHCEDELCIMPDDILEAKTEIEKVDLETIIAGFTKSYEDEITCTEQGKPYFVHHRELCYNLSHSGWYAVCIIGNVPVGIDIEGRRPLRLKVAKRFFSAQEYDWIMESEGGADNQQQQQRKEQRFFRIWTLKEAYVKATGVGIGKGIKSVEFIPSAKNSDSLVFADAKLAEKYCMQEYEWDGYRIAAIISRGQTL